MAWISWLRIGEAVGYGAAALILGPRAALQRRHLRTIRRAFAYWLSDEQYTKQVATHGRVRRLVERTDDELAFLLECELQPGDDLATIVIQLEKLPGMTEDKVVAETKAPLSADEWSHFASGAVREAAELIRRHRGEGYR